MNADGHLSLGSEYSKKNSFKSMEWYLKGIENLTLLYFLHSKYQMECHFQIR